MADFTFTQLSNSSESYTLFGNPSINNTGTVTYEAFPGVCTSIGGDCLQVGTNAPPAAIFTSKKDGPTNLVVNRSTYSGFDGYNSGVFFSGSTNDAGTTVLGASGYNYGQLVAGGPSAILSRTNSGPINNVSYSGTPFGVTLRNPNLSPPALYDTGNLAATGNFASAPGINNLGTIAGIIGQNDGQNQTTGLYTKSVSGQITKIADTNEGFSNFYTGGVDVGRGKGPFAAYTLPSINDSGTVAFNAGLKWGGTGIFTGNGSTITPIADTNNGIFTKFSVPSLNQSGAVAFDAGLANGESAIFISSDGKLTPIAYSGNSFFKDLTKSDIAFNNQGQVAFLAETDDGTTGIFTGSSGGGEKVISVGDSLAGSTVKTLFISHDGLNDANKIAFDAVLADGTQRVFLADPTGIRLLSSPTAVPEPGSTALFALVILGMIGYRWRRRRVQATGSALRDN